MADVRTVGASGKAETSRGPEQGFGRLVTSCLVTRTVMRLNALSTGRGVPDGTSERQGRGGDGQCRVRENSVARRDQGRGPRAGTRDRGPDASRRSHSRQSSEGGGVLLTRDLSWGEGPGAPGTSGRQRGPARFGSRRPGVTGRIGGEHPLGDRIMCRGAASASSLRRDSSV